MHDIKLAIVDNWYCGYLHIYNTSMWKSECLYYVNLAPGGASSTYHNEDYTAGLSGVI